MKKTSKYTNFYEDLSKLICNITLEQMCHLSLISFFPFYQNILFSYNTVVKLIN